MIYLISWVLQQPGTKNAFLLSQCKYALELLDRENISNRKPCRTLADMQSKLDSDVTPVTDPTSYRSLAGGLQYLTLTRLDLCFVVKQICLFMHDPWEPHMKTLKCVLLYVSGTLDYGLQIHPSHTTGLIAYSDADWGGCPTRRRSTSGYYVFLGGNLLSWLSKRQ